MTWHDLSANWIALQGRLRQRFPRLDVCDISAPPRDRMALTRELAEAHEISMSEAHSELDRFMAAEDLARSSMDLRAG